MSQPIHLVRLVYRIGTGFGLFGALARLLFGQRIASVLALTWKAAFRYRLFWVITSLLLAAVVALPLLIKDDGTAAGFAQILITYTLAAVTALLGFCTLWLSCGTLARDIEECQIQVVAVKPIARWQIWLGKWLGIVTLNAALLAVAGASIFGLLEWRARKLPAAELTKLQDEVLIARASAREENLDAAIEKETDREFQRQMEKHASNGANPRVLREQIAAQVKAEFQVVPPGQVRPWLIHLGRASAHLKDQPLYVRVKFNTADALQTGTYFAAWQVGMPRKTQVWQDTMPSLAPDTFHEFKIPPNMFDEKGDLLIMFRNENNTALLFTLNEGLEVLYREGGFGLNFARGLGIILCWMALLAAMGLAAASLLSFPVAAFASMALLAMTFSSGTLSNVVQEGTIMGYDEEKGAKGHSAVDNVAVPTFRAMLEVIQLVQQFSPIDSLSTGRSITWLQLTHAVAQIVLLMGGIFGLTGIFIFNRRELATAQGTS
jgi:ABC-type transport system involved in multi-copper enzyme maturation permease subunit